MFLRPRLRTSNNATPLPCDLSFGASTKRSATKATRPAASRGALSRSAIDLLRGSSRSISSRSRRPAAILASWQSRCAAAVAWVHKNAAKFGGDPSRLYVGGHSSGGHLCGVVLVTDYVMRASINEHLGRIAVILGRTAKPSTAMDENENWRVLPLRSIDVETLGCGWTVGFALGSADPRAHRLAI